MTLKTNVGQIYLTHPKDENFTSIYEEAFTKHGQPVELFVVVEISGNGSAIGDRRGEYEKLVQTFVSALKKTYVSAPVVDQDTFERALAAINTSISKIASRGKVNWYGKFHAAVAAFWQNQLALSTAGNAVVCLNRKKEIVSLSEDILGKPIRPVKIFSNFSTGKLIPGDRVVLSTNQMFNYLSLERMREFLNENTLEETCQEIISLLQDIKTAGFASFIFETFAPGQTLAVAAHHAQAGSASAEKEKVAPIAAAVPSEMAKIGKIAFRFFVNLLKFIWIVILKIFDVFLGLLSRLFGKRSKKYAVAAIALALIVFAVNIGLAAIRKSNRQRTSQENSALAKVEEKLNEAEAALIYDDQNRIIALLTEAEEELKNIKSAKNQDNEKRKSVEDRLAALKNQINKETKIENPVVLTSYSNVPTDLIRSPDGIIGFNRESGSMSFYDFRTGETKTLLKNTNTGNLIGGAYVGGNLGYVFLARSGNFSKLDLQSDNLIEQGATDAPTLDLKTIEPRGLAVLGEGALARLYLVDPKQNQIWRLRVTESGIASPEKWLKTTSASFDGARGLTVDGSIYVVFENKIEKFFNGNPADFQFSEIIPPLEKFTKIASKSEDQYIYALHPSAERIVIFTKAGKLFQQLVSPKFRDLADIYVDEKNKVIHAISGSELLQINF